MFFLTIMPVAEDKNYLNTFAEQSGSKIAGFNICMDHIHQKNVALKASFS